MLCTGRAVKFIRERKDEPSFLYLPKCLDEIAGGGNLPG